MTISIFSNGKQYVSASRAAEEIGYSSDYIGQLCRLEKIPGKLIGRTWYVDLEALESHRKSRKLGKPLSTRVGESLEEAAHPRRSGSFREANMEPAEVFSTHKELVFEKEERPLIPQVRKINRRSGFTFAKQGQLSSNFVITSGVAVVVLVTVVAFSYFSISPGLINAPLVATPPGADLGSENVLFKEARQKESDMDYFSGYQPGLSANAANSHNVVLNEVVHGAWNSFKIRVAAPTGETLRSIYRQASRVGEMVIFIIERAISTEIRLINKADQSIGICQDERCDDVNILREVGLNTQPGALDKAEYLDETIPGAKSGGVVVSETNAGKDRDLLISIGTNIPSNNI